MEGAPKLENVENLNRWRELKAEAPSHAQKLIASVEGFDHMGHSEQIQILTTLEESLLENNDNRYLAREIARKRALVEEDARHRGVLQSLKQAA